jgi:hypothetical protein
MKYLLERFWGDGIGNGEIDNNVEGVRLSRKK